jgi:Caspase domain
MINRFNTKVAKLKKLALVIGNSNYKTVDFIDLPNAALDSVEIAKSLEERGFETTLHTDLTGNQMSDAVTLFNEKITSGHTFSVFYYAGHGCEQHGLTYLHATDMPSNKPSAILQYGVPLTEVLGASVSKNNPRILILDCCRTSESNWTPDERVRFEQLATEANHRINSIQLNTLIAYSTSAGESASDGFGMYGPYCRQFSLLLKKHRLTVEDVFKEVGLNVTNESMMRQRPWVYSNLSSEISFSDLPNVVATIVVGSTPPSIYTGGLVKDPHEQRVISYREGHKHAVCTDGVATEGRYSFDQAVKLMTTWRNGLVIFDSQSSLAKQIQGDSYQIVETSIKDPHFIASSPDGNYVILGGNNKFHLIDLKLGKIYEVETPNQSWYSALFINETLAWIVGNSGGLREIDFKNTNPVSQEIELGIHNHLYTICRIDISNLVIGGSGGKLFMLSQSTRSIIWRVALGDSVRTPAARMQSILNTADNEFIRRFLFEPTELPIEDVQEIRGKLASNNLMFSAKSATSPILIVASDEGLLYLLDCRDGQLIEVIDSTAGRATSIDGVCFLDESQFAVLDRAGMVLFYSLTSTSYDSARKYVDEMDWQEDSLLS